MRDISNPLSWRLLDVFLRICTGSTDLRRRNIDCSFAEIHLCPGEENDQNLSIWAFLRIDKTSQRAKCSKQKLLSCIHVTPFSTPRRMLNGALSIAGGGCGRNSYLDLQPSRLWSQHLQVRVPNGSVTGSIHHLLGFKDATPTWRVLVLT